MNKAILVGRLTRDPEVRYSQCIQRYAERLTEDQLNEILLGLENGLTEEEVKSYFTFPVEKMNQYRRAYQFMQ